MRWWSGHQSRTCCTHLQTHRSCWVQPLENKTTTCPSWSVVRICCSDGDNLKPDAEGHRPLRHPTRPPWHSGKCPWAEGPAAREEGSWIGLGAGRLWGRWCSSGRSGIWSHACGPERKRTQQLHNWVTNERNTKKHKGSSDEQLTTLGMGTSSWVPVGARTAKMVWPGRV